jgi:hypothetical protein
MMGICEGIKKRFQASGGLIKEKRKREWEL